MSFVLDASIALAWCFGDEQTAPVMALLDLVAESGASAPLLWPVEVLNGLLSAERRGRIDAARRRRLAGFLRGLPIAIDLETASRLWADTAALAERYGLTAYDSTYLELALRLGLPLATGDRKLAAAAQEAGVETLPASSPAPKNC